MKSNKTPSTRLSGNAFLATASLLAAGAASLPAQNLSNSVQPYGSITGSAEYTSNAFLNAFEESDTIFRLTPLIGFTKEDGMLNLDGSVGVVLQRYSDFSENDAENPFARLEGSYSNKPLNVSAGIGYQQTTQASQAVGAIFETDIFNAGGDFDYYISSATGLSGGLDYTLSEAEGTNLGETTVWAFSGGGFYEYSSQLRFNANLHYRDTEVSQIAGATSDSEDIGFSIGAVGQLTPVIEGEAAIGFQERSFDDAALGDETSPFLSLNTTWQMTSLTRLEVGGLYDFSTNVSNQSSESFTLLATLHHTFSQRYSGNFGVGYEDSSFASVGQPERDDEQFSVFGGVSYQMTDWGSINLQLNYLDRDSDQNFFIYDAFSATLSVTASF